MEKKNFKKFGLGKEVISNLQREQMGAIVGGDEDWIDDTNTNLWGSRVTCTTKWQSGNCGPSKSCQLIVCIPCNTTMPV